MTSTTTIILNSFGMSAIGLTNSQPSATIDHDDATRNIEIFLGGSCNPTTWRKKVAIPYLEMNGISYYNPQITDWTPEVVSLEHTAKQKAKVLFFVIDKQTRSTVSIVESAFMATQNRHIVLVIFPLDEETSYIFPPTDERLSSSDLIKSLDNLDTTNTELSNHELNSAYTKTKAISKLSSSTTTSVSTLISKSSNGKKHSSLSTEATRASSLLKTSITKKSSVDVDKFGKTSIESIEQRSSKTTNKSLSTAIMISGEAVSWREFQELKQARNILKCLVSLRNIPIYSDIHQALKYVSNYLKSHDKSRNWGSCFNRNLLSESHKYVKCSKDVFLSLDSDDFKVNKSTLFNQLEERGLTYRYMCVNNIKNTALEFKPEEPSHIESISSTCSSILSSRTKIENTNSDDLSVATTRIALEQDLNAIESSRVLLFVITNRCRGLSIMVLASHFMALSNNNVVLCVQDLEEPCYIGGELLTSAAIADYNRGRVYLCDYAVKAQVPIFSSIQDAVDCCTKKCRSINSEGINCESSGCITLTK